MGRDTGLEGRSEGTDTSTIKTTKELEDLANRLFSSGKIATYGDMVRVSNIAHYYSYELEALYKCGVDVDVYDTCLLYTSPSPRDS